ncbi:hypothetical protein HA402_008034 [Bradysia odoriphaga]|nr:hypothetical protein HA402_008034 [Bradysia odoriphaga]
MTITEAIDLDIPQLNVLIERCYRGESSKQGWTSEADMLGGIRTNEELLKAEMTASGARFLKYTDEEGCISGCVYTRLIPEEKKVYIGMLCVNPQIQAKGLGKQLMAAAENIGLENGCTTATIVVISRRTELLAWYERRGYAPTGEVQPFAAAGGIGDEKVENLQLKTMAKLLQ